MELNYTGLAISIIFGLIIWYVYEDYVAPYHDKYLTFWPRFWAPDIDNVVLWIPTSLIPYAIYRTFDLEGNAANLLFGLVCFINFLYTIYFHGMYGATIGKMITKVEVVDAISEGPITFKQAIMRDSPPIIISIIILLYAFTTGNDISEDNFEHFSYMPMIALLWFLAEVITMLTNKKRRALHDYIAGTVVIRSNIGDPEIEPVH